MIWETNPPPLSLFLRLIVPLRRKFLDCKEEEEDKSKKKIMGRKRKGGQFQWIQGLVFRVIAQICQNTTFGTLPPNIPLDFLGRLVDLRRGGRSRSDSLNFLPLFCLDHTEEIIMNVLWKGKKNQSHTHTHTKTHWLVSWIRCTENRVKKRIHTRWFPESSFCTSSFPRYREIKSCRISTHSYSTDSFEKCF